MNPEQWQRFFAILAAARQHPPYLDSKGQPCAYPRGWNGALDFVERTRKEVMGENETCT